MTRITFPILHGDGEYPTGWLHSDWRPVPTVVIGVFALVAAYLWWTGPRNRMPDGRLKQPVSSGQRVAFVAGSLVLLLALNPPLDDWADTYLLTAHMGQHLLLMFLVAPLWLIGTPPWLLGGLVRNRVVERIGYVLTRPPVALVVSNAVVVFWHLPFAYDAALRGEPIHILQHNAFIGAALLAWWPVLGTFPAWPRLSPPLRCLYLFLYSIPGGIVGAFITLAEPGLYSAYDDDPRIWGIDLAMDQELAGLMMWVLTSTIYLLVITVVFLTWASREEAKDRAVSPEPLAASR